MKYAMRHPILVLEAWWIDRADKRRLDRHPGNLLMVFGLILSSASIILRGPTPSSALIDMGDELQISMCVCIFVGLSIKAHGVFAHSRFYFPKTPLRKCYQYGYRGAPVASSGLFVYGWFLLHNTTNWTSAVGVVLTPLMGLGVLLSGVMYWLEARRLELLERQMISIAKSFKENGTNGD